MHLITLRNVCVFLLIINHLCISFCSRWFLMVSCNVQDKLSRWNGSCLCSNSQRYECLFLELKGTSNVWVIDLSLWHTLKQLKGSDTPTAESGYEVEDIASPRAARNYSHLRFTPVRERGELSTFRCQIFVLFLKCSLIVVN